MNRSGALAAFLLLIPGFLFAQDGAPADPPTHVGVNALLRRMELALAKKDEDLFRSCFASDAVLVDPPEKGTSGSQVFCHESLQSLLHLTVTHTTMEVAEFLAIDGTGAFTLRQDDEAADLLLTSAIRVKTVREVPATVGWIDRRFMGTLFANDRWQLIFSFPCFVESRVVVTEVAPGTQGERLGMRVGDVITHHLQMAIFDSEQLVWRAKMFDDDPPARQLRVLVRRENRLIPLVFVPGEMGIKTRNHFEGRVDTITLTGEQAREHPITETMAGYHEALRQGDVARVRAALCSEGFAFCHGLPSVPTLGVITSRNAADAIAKELERLATRIRPETLEVSDVRIILYGDLALAGWHVSARTFSGDSFDRDVVACLVGAGNRWCLVGMPWQDQHVLGW
jgi:hypothetical protein